MKKIIVLIIALVTINYAMTLAESKSEVNHCHTRFEKTIDKLKNCKIDRKSKDIVINCENGFYVTNRSLNIQGVRILKGDNILVTFYNSEFCLQETFDEFNVTMNKEKLYFYNSDAMRIYKYAKTKLLGK